MTDALDPRLAETPSALSKTLGFEMTGWAEGIARIEAPLAPGARGIVTILDSASYPQALTAANTRLEEIHQVFASGPTMVFRWLPAPGWHGPASSPSAPS